MQVKKRTYSLLILFMTLLISTVSYASTTNTHTVGVFTPYTNINNNMLVNQTELEFYFTYRTKTEDNRLKDFTATSITCNNKKSIPYGKNYKVSLKEGTNIITTTFKKDGYDITNSFKIICDTNEPSIQTLGIHNFMIVNEDELSFRVKVKDDLTSSENIKLQVRFKDVNLRPKNDQYHITATKKDWNTVTLLATDEAGNSKSEKIELIYYPLNITPKSALINQLTEYVPSLGINLKQSKGVTQGEATEVGTFGGYVILKLNKAIKNVDGPDLAVKGSWTSENTPLYSVAVLRDGNKNGLPDETNWYYLSDEVEIPHEETVTSVTYKRDEEDLNKGFITINEGGSYTIESTQGPVFVNSFDYADLGFEQTLQLEGVLREESDQSNITTFAKEHRYEFETARTASGKKARVIEADFIKIYANSMLVSEEGIPVTTDIYYARTLNPIESSLELKEELNHSNYPFYYNDDRVAFDRPIHEYKAGDTVTISYAPYRDVVPYDMIVEKMYFEDRFDTYYSMYMREALDKRLAVTQTGDTSFSFVMPDTPIEIMPQVSRSNDDIKSFLDKFKTFSKEDLVYYNIKAIKRMEALYKHNKLDLSDNEKDQLLAIVELKNSLLSDKIVAAINAYSYDFKELLELKVMFDELSLEFKESLPEEALIKLDQDILSLVDQPIEEAMNNQTGHALNYKYGLGLSLSKEDIERATKPTVMINQNKDGSLAFTLYKDKRKQFSLIGPLNIKIED